MKRSLTLSLFLLMGSIVLASATEEVRITGYGTGEYAVKENVEQQMNQLAALISKQRPAANSQINITVMGYADRTGPGSLNDRLGDLRAGAVQKFLSLQFPQAKIVPMTKGASAPNKTETPIKMVIVQWSFTAPAPSPLPTPVSLPSQDASKYSAWMWSTISVVLLFVVFSTTILFLRKHKSVEANPIQVPVQVVTFVQPEAVGKDRWVDVEVDGKKYSVLVNWRNGAWYTPFTKQDSPDKPEYRKELGDANKCIRTCLKNHFYGPAIKQLIAAGLIRNITAEQAEKERSLEKVQEAV